MFAFNLFIPTWFLIPLLYTSSSTTRKIHTESQGKIWGNVILAKYARARSHWDDKQHYSYKALPIYFVQMLDADQKLDMKRFESAKPFEKSLIGLLDPVIVIIKQHTFEQIRHFPCRKLKSKIGFTSNFVLKPIFGRIQFLSQVDE